MMDRHLRNVPKALFFVAALGSVAIVAACGDDAADSLNGRRGTGSSGSSGTSGTSGGSGDPNDPTNPANLPPEEQKFRAVEGDLQKSCGNGCHDLGTFTTPAPTFLAGPDAYKSIKAHPGIVVRDVYASALLTKGSHAGPALSQNADLEKKVVEWLEAESILIQSQKLPSTPPVAVTLGPNDIDLTPACISGMTGVHLKFEAALVGTMLSLSKLTVVVPAGSDAHILQPRFVRVLPAPKEDGTTDVPDPADSFSNSDQTVPAGKETALAPGSVLFSGAGWRPFDVAKDKIRIEVQKLEPGKVSVVSAAATCKNVQGFQTNVLNQIRNQATTNGTCGGCHGGGLAGLSLGSQDNALVCQQVLGKLNQANIGQSLIVTKVQPGSNHGGGQVADINAWRALFVNNAGVFF